MLYNSTTMKLIEMQQYRQDVKQQNDALNAWRDVLPAEQRLKELQQQTAAVKRRVDFVLRGKKGMKAYVGKDMDNNVLGATRQKGDLIINETHLENDSLTRGQLVGVIIHELLHNETSISEIRLNEQEAIDLGFKDDHVRILGQVLGIKNEFFFNGTAFMEGANQAGTEQRLGYRMSGVYEGEKEAFGRLNNAVRSKLQKSLLDCYLRGDKTGMLELLKQLADQLLLIKALKEEGISGADYDLVYHAIRKGGLGEVRNIEHAKELVAGQLWIERVQLN